MLKSIVAFETLLVLLSHLIFAAGYEDINNKSILSFWFKYVSRFG